ncbi:hypothetical protein NDA11_004118 [Ustilago hordei]|nr:hypothetical protein NDA11_004118 [Ustilago hordei]
MRQWKPALLALASTLGYGTSLWPTTQQGQAVDPSILTSLGAWSFYVPNGDIGRYDIPDAVFPGCEVDQQRRRLLLEFRNRRWTEPSRASLFIRSER